MQCLWCGSLGGLDSIYIPLHQNSSKGQFLAWARVGLQPECPGVVWVLCDPPGPVALQPAGQTQGLWKQGGEVWSAWLCPLGRGDTVSMPSARSKANQIVQDIFSTEHQGELSGMKRNADLHQKPKYKPIACHRFSFFLSFIYDCDISVLCIYLLLPGVSGLHISFAQMGCITQWRMISLCWRGSCARSMHVISYLLPPWRQPVANRQIIRVARAADLWKVWVLS